MIFYHYFVRVKLFRNEIYKNYFLKTKRTHEIAKSVEMLLCYSLDVSPHFNLQLVENHVRSSSYK